MNRIVRYGIIGIAVALSAAGCSTTSRLGQDEVLYTGVKKIAIRPDSGVELSSTVESAIKAPLSVKPNNPLYSPYIRTPLPVGLWAYNHLYTPKEKGFKYWLYRKLSKQPVLVSKVQPEIRTKYVDDVLGNYGYFDADAGYELLPRRNPKKAKISYSIRVGQPSVYMEIRYPQVQEGMARLVDSLESTSLLRVGAQYNTDTLSAERTRITNVLRNRGYYYFRPEYIDYQADTTQQKNRVDLRMRLTPGIPAPALVPYRVGRITVSLQNIRGGAPDTLHLPGQTVVYQKPLKIRPKLLAKSITMKTGDLFTVNAQNTTLSNLNKLGIFRSVNLGVTPLDSLDGKDTLNVYLSAGFDYPLEAELEMNVTSKSNSFLGPGLAFKVSNNNLFRGGEVLSLRLNGNYEWETGNKNSGGAKTSLLNSYEFGLNATLNVQRLLLPRFITKGSRYPSSTSFQLGVDLMNRPKFFQLISFSGSIGYNFQTSPYSYHSLSLLKLSYNNLLHTTESFDQTMDENPAIALSFRDQFIPAMSYSYTYDRTYRRNRFFWQNTVTSAGNLLYAIWEACGQHGTKRLFNNQFSQCIKDVNEVKFYQKLGDKNNWLAYRFLVGAGYAYGNSSVMPYSEQFYIGGANSIRAFTIRSIGPGSYHPAQNDRNSYLDQTGDFKLEANVEFRFGIMGRLGGAVFLDAGNIWLLKNDPNRPGGVLKWRGFFNEIALGTGFGLRYDISYLVLRADLGIALHTPYPNPDKPGYYNISKFKDGLGFHVAIGYPF